MNLIFQLLSIGWAYLCAPLVQTQSLDCDGAFDCENISPGQLQNSINLSGYKSGVNMIASGQYITAGGAYAAQNASFSYVRELDAIGSHSVCLETCQNL